MKIKISEKQIILLSVIGLSSLILGIILYCVGNYAYIITYSYGNFGNFHWGQGLHQISTLSNSYLGRTNGRLVQFLVIFGTLLMIFWGVCSVGCVIYFLYKQFGGKLEFKNKK